MAKRKDFGYPRLITFGKPRDINWWRKLLSGKINIIDDIYDKTA